METRQSHVLVGAVTFLLVVALFAFILWLSRYTGQERDRYDIFFQQSVAGLAIGSNVSFSGVPVGQVREIALMPESPEFVRVRIEVRPEVPVLEGTTATLQGVGFTGVTEIQLSGSVRGQKPLTEPGPYGVPVIPAAASGFGQLLETAPQVLERVSTLVARLNEVLDDDNRKALAGILANLDRTTAVLADEERSIRSALRETESTLKAATAAAAQLERTGATAEALLTEDGKPLVAELRRSVVAAQATLKQLERVAAAAEPGVQSLATQTVPQVNQLVAELRDVSQQMGALAARLDEDPLGALTGGRPLPDYQPEKRR
jgi:phospholipid/cholesterol/gamma-HCH transport system substrate-binding protein